MPPPTYTAPLGAPPQTAPFQTAEQNQAEAQRASIVSRTRGGYQGQSPANQFGVHGTIAKNVLAHWKFNAKLAMTCDRRFQSDLDNSMDTGDTITFRRMPTYGIQRGLEAWNPQEKQEELITLTVSNPQGIQTEEEWNVEGLYRNEAYSQALKVAQAENLAYAVDTDIAEVMTGTQGYTNAVTPLGRTAAGANFTLAPAGYQSGEFGTFNRNRLFTYCKAELAARGIEGRALHAMVDHYTSASIGDVALFNQYYSQGGAGAQAQSQGTVDGQMIGGWKITDCSLNGQQTIGECDHHITVSGNQAITADGLTSVNLARSAGAGTTQLKAGTRISFGGVPAVNTRTKLGTGDLQQYVVTSDVTINTAATAVSVSPPIRQAPAPTSNTVATAFRRRNTSATRLESGATVFVNGLDTSSAQQRAALATEVTTTRSLLVAQDSTILVYALPYIDPNGPLQVSKMTLKDSGVAYCVGIDQELKGHRTYYEIWSRIGLAVGEWEAGYIATGQRGA